MYLRPSRPDLIVPFPVRPYGKRRLHPDGEHVDPQTSEERLWWIQLLRCGDVVSLEHAPDRERVERAKPPSRDKSPTPQPR